MTAPRPYTVFRPTPVRRLGSRLWCVDDEMPTIPGKRFPRTMTIVRLVDGTLLFHNAIPLPDATLAEVHALGQPRWLFITSLSHTLDARAFAERLSLTVLAPAPLCAPLATRFSVGGDVALLPADATLRFEPLDGIPGGEGFFWLDSDGQSTLIIGDLILNIPHLPGPWGWVWRLMGLTGGPRIGPLWMKRVVRDRVAFKAHLQRLARGPLIHRVIPSHGPPLVADVNAIFAALAAPL